MYTKDPHRVRRTIRARAAKGIDVHAPLPKQPQLTPTALTAPSCLSRGGLRLSPLRPAGPSATPPAPPSLAPPLPTPIRRRVPHRFPAAAVAAWINVLVVLSRWVPYANPPLGVWVVHIADMCHLPGPPLGAEPRLVVQSLDELYDHGTDHRVGEKDLQVKWDWGGGDGGGGLAVGVVELEYGGRVELA